MQFDDYINQFDLSDLAEVNRFFGALEFVSFNTVKNDLIQLIRGIQSQNGHKVGIFMVKKSVQPERISYTSAEYLGYAIRDLITLEDRKYLLEPTVERLRTERIKTIILVDDIIGSGTRVSQYIKDKINKTIRSWVSKKKIKIYVVSYVLYPAGKANILSTTKTIPNCNIVSSKLANQDNPILSGNFDILIEKYGKKTNKPCAATGYKQTKGYHIFEYACPNNTPSMIWASGKTWKALFPEQTIPTHLKFFFQNNYRSQKILNKIYDQGQSHLALGLLSLIEKETKTEDQINTLLILSLLNRGILIRNLTKVTTIEKIEIGRSISQLKKAGFIDNNGKVTPLGAKMLDAQKNKVNHKIQCPKEEHTEGHLPKRFNWIPVKI